jgi:hypothetical protein
MDAQNNAAEQPVNQKHVDELKMQIDAFIGLYQRRHGKNFTVGFLMVLSLGFRVHLRLEAEPSFSVPLRGLL